MHVFRQIKDFYTSVTDEMREQCRLARLLFAGVDRLMKPPPNVRYKHAGVLVIYMLDEEQIKVVFIRRAIDGGIHSGQVAFPGGGFDKKIDKNFLHTAIRETNEEIGLKIEPEKVVYKLTSLYVPPSRYMVHPYLAVVEHQQQFQIDRTEVTEVYQIPLNEVLKAPVESRTFQTLYGQVYANCYQVYGLYIWGATAIILTELLCLEKYRQGIHCQP